MINSATSSESTSNHQSACSSIHRHGGVQGVTGSCHRLQVTSHQVDLVDYCLSNGKDHGPGDILDRHEIDFPIDDVITLLTTHVHIDHVDRIPYLLAAGYLPRDKALIWIKTTHHLSAILVRLTRV